MEYYAMSVRRFPPPFLHATQENSYLSTLPIMLERIQKKERKKKDKKKVETVGRT